jgi:hypothetical protein
MTEASMGRLHTCFWRRELHRQFLVNLTTVLHQVHRLQEHISGVNLHIHRSSVAMVATHALASMLLLLSTVHCSFVVI